MIHSVSCDQRSFKKIDFKRGMNVVLAERVDGSTERDTRNGLGKSALVEIIHFCLGGKKAETLNKENVDGWEFAVSLDIGDRAYSVRRNTGNARNIIVEGDCAGWPAEPSVDRDGRQYFSQSVWNEVLGALMCGLDLEYATKYHPTFRSLISYFVRRGGEAHGYGEFSRQSRQQQPWDISVNNAYLLGLGWEFAARLQLLQDERKSLKELKKAVTTGVMSNLVGKPGEIESAKIRLENQIAREEKNLREFKVHEQYHEVEAKASDMARAIRDLSNLNFGDKRLLDSYMDSTVTEKDASAEQVAGLYAEAGVVFSERLLKQLGDVMSFHRQVVANRRSFLASEIARLEGEIEKRTREMEAVDLEKSDLMKILKTHGALEEFSQMQANHQRLIGELENMTAKLENMKKLSEEKNRIDIETKTAIRQTETDLDERRAQKEAAILAFNTFSEKLYEAPGALSIDVGDKGYDFGVRIERSGSGGLENMKIFCYDLMLAKLWARRPASPGFLVHDSTLFADVDERQIALSLQTASDEAEKEQFQYICMLNSDTVPRRDFSPGFDFDSSVVAKLTDASDDGGLLGIRF